MFLFSSMEYFNILGEIKLLDRVYYLLLCRTSVLQYVNTAVLQNCIRLQFFGAHQNCRCLKRAPRALRYSVFRKIKVNKGGPLLNMKFFKFNGIPQRPSGNQTVRKGNQLNTLQNCSTSILQYPRTALDFIFLVSIESQVLDIFFLLERGEPSQLEKSRQGVEIFR